MKKTVFVGNYARSSPLSSLTHSCAWCGVEIRKEQVPGSYASLLCSCACRANYHLLGLFNPRPCAVSTHHRWGCDWEYAHPAPHIYGRGKRNRKFRPSDLQYGIWPDGTIFVHVRTGQVREWRDRQAAAPQSRGNAASSAPAPLDTIPVARPRSRRREWEKVAERESGTFCPQLVEEPVVKRKKAQDMRLTYRISPETRKAIEELAGDVAAGEVVVALLEHGLAAIREGRVRQ